MFAERETKFFRFCNSNETSFFRSKYRMEACQQMSYDLVFKSKQGPNLSYHKFENDKKFWRKRVTFNFYKTQQVKHTHTQKYI